MTLPTKEWLQGFHDAEGSGIDPYPLVEAAFLAHELLEALELLYIDNKNGCVADDWRIEKAKAVIAKATGKEEA